MMLLSTSAGVRPCTAKSAAARPSLSSRPSSMPAFVQRRQVAARGLGDLIGEVNNPEKTRANEKAKKEGDGQWGEPAPNKNKLEKKTVAHGIGSESQNEGGSNAAQDAVDGAKEGVDSAVESAKDALKKATGQD